MCYATKGTRRILMTREYSPPNESVGKYLLRVQRVLLN